MKNNLLLSFSGLIFSLLLITGCKKEISNIEKDVSLQNSVYRKLNQTEEQILNNAQNADDLKVRKAKLIFGNAMADVFKNQSYVSLAIKDAKSSPLNEADISRMRIANADFKKDFDVSLAEHYSKSGANSGNNAHKAEQIFDLLTNQLTYDIKYIPKIVIPNLSVLNESENVITSAGLDLSEEFDASLDDDIWAREYFEAKGFVDIILSETEAKASKKPILIFANGEEDTKYNGALFFEGVQQQTSSFKTDEAAAYSTKRFAYQHISVKKPDYFYDGCCKNNYAYTGLYFSDQGSWAWCASGSNQDLARVVTQFRKSECNGVQRTVWGDVYNAAARLPNPTEHHKILINTFERDWYAGVKDLGHYTFNGVTGYLGGRRTYNSEWYLSDPNTQGGLVMNGNVITLWQYLDAQSFKTKFAMTRTN